MILLIIQDKSYTIQNLQRSPTPQTSNWSGTFFCCFLQQTVFKTHITLKYFLTTIGSWKNIAAPPTSYSAFAGVTNNNPWLHLSFRNIIAPFMGPFWLLLMSNVETNMIWQHETNQSIELLAKKDFRFSLHSNLYIQSKCLSCSATRNEFYVL